jgi:Lrp/AsnC family leucine-responsive transcriptional regulator
MELDRTDRRILALLQEDGRRSNVEIAERVALSPSPCLRRIKRLEAAGVIRGYRAIIDRDAIGVGLTVLIDIKIGQHSKENAAILQQTLVSMPEVVSCHMISGTADFSAEIVVRDLQEYERLLTERILVLPMIVDVRSNISLRRIKSEAPLPLKSQDEQTMQKPKVEARPSGREPAVAARRGRRV